MPKNKKLNFGKRKAKVKTNLKLDVDEDAIIAEDDEIKLKERKKKRMSKILKSKTGQSEADFSSDNSSQLKKETSPGKVADTKRSSDPEEDETVTEQVALTKRFN